ncbi:MAG: hypothetical protein ACODAD_10090 [Planctomycetota bacterium]
MTCRHTCIDCAGKPDVDRKMWRLECTQHGTNVAFYDYTVSGNEADSHGGGVYAAAGNTTVYLQNMIVADNNTSGDTRDDISGAVGSESACDVAGRRASLADPEENTTRAGPWPRGDSP